jgi:hypothetical protein
LVAISLASVLSLFTWQRALAWGGAGHQAVCQIAFLELKPETQAKVQKIMAKETDNNFKPFATACTWADSGKHTSGTIQNKRQGEHFVNVDRGLATITTDSCGASSKCLFTAIPADEAVLKNSTGKKQLEALKFLGHWVGDLHQPLHISYADDSGGNAIPVSGTASCGGFTDEIHGVWDECVVKAVRTKIGASGGSTDLGTKLQAEITDAERAEWRKGTLVDWAEESYVVTRDAATKYCLEENGSCCYDNDRCKYKKNAAKTQRLVQLAQNYDDANVEIGKERLKKAGVRLAFIIETQLQ